MNLDELCVNTIRFMAVDCVERAKSGHPGMPMGSAPMAYVLWTRFLRHNPLNPGWPDRDRFILSAGHGSMLLYSLLHLTGYELSLEELKNFRQWGSLTPGHPESNLTPGVETTTGPLGQGFANGVGMAIAESYLAARFNRPGHEIVNHFTYGIVSDGDLMEGLTHEAASLAAHLRLGKLIYLYDDNHISIDGSTDLAFTENRVKRFVAYGWHVQEVRDGNDLKALEMAIETAREHQDRPSLIAVRTHIGYGSPNKQDKASAHGEPLGPEEVKLAKKNLDWPMEPECYIPEDALRHFRKAIQRGKEVEEQWQRRFAEYEKAYPEEASEWKRWLSMELPRDWEKYIPSFPKDEKGMATRVASGTVLNTVASKITNLIGGSADLAPSNKTYIKDEPSFQADCRTGRNLHFGVREHGMGSILNGMALHGALIPYGGTFLVFSDYMRPPIRLAAMMKLRVIYVFTHDSIGLGEDGPTHQPIEQLAALRAIPGLTVIRPCDANETAEAWRYTMKKKGGPVALILSRQGLPTLDRRRLSPASGVQKGAYVISQEQSRPADVILIGTGSEVHIVLGAADTLRAKGLSVRVVSMPSWELFEQQPESYRNDVLPPDIEARVAVEAGITMGWRRYVGGDDAIVGIDRFGASAPYKVLYERFGITEEEVVKKALRVMERIRNSPER